MRAEAEKGQSFEQRITAPVRNLWLHSESTVGEFGVGGAAREQIAAGDGKTRQWQNYARGKLVLHVI